MTAGGVIPALTAAVVASLLVAAAAGRPFALGRPPVAFAVFGVATVTLGSASAAATRYFFPAYDVPLARALWLEAMGFAVTALVVAGVRLVPPRAAAIRWAWIPPRLDLVIAILTGLSVVGTILAVRRIGYVPLFRGDVREERYFNVLTEQAGVFYRLSLLGVPAAILGGVRSLAGGRNRASAFAAALSVFCVSLYGPRFYPVVALASLAVVWDLYRARLRIWQIAAAALLGLPTLVFAALHREGIAETNAGALVTLSYFSFGEFRDFAASVPYFDGPERRLHGETIPSVIVPLLPGKAWSIVGVDKASLYARNSADVMSEYMNVTTGIRIGVVGELNMNFGFPGVAIGMAILGVILAGLDRLLASSRLDSPWTPFAALATVLTVFTLVGQLNMYTSSLASFGYPLLVAAIVAGRRVASPAP